MYTVRDGQRELRFDGELLSSSTSAGPGRTRWVEFELYRTAGGLYVLSRVGRSRYYHDMSCDTVRRNRIAAQAFSDVDLAYYLPCQDCSPRPELVSDKVAPEQPRYWAQVSDSAEGVVASLQKFDPSGTRYLTNVARRLLEDASVKDEEIRSEFYVEIVE
jgi:hypothetical protein